MPNALDDAALTQLLDIGFDFLCTRRVDELVDPARVVQIIDATHTETSVGYFQQRVAVPLRERLFERAKKSQVKLGDWLPEPAKQGIAAFLGMPAPIPQKLIDEAVASEGVRDQIRESLRESISSFVSKGTSGGGVGSALGFGARAFGAAGKAMLGGLGEGLQKQLQDKVREFVDGAVEGVQDRIAKRLADPATAEALGKRRQKAFLKLLETTEREAGAQLAKGPHAAIDMLVPSIVRHNVQRKELRDAIREEVAIVVADLSKETIGEVLDHAGARAVAREALQAHGLPLLREMCKTPAFVAWWDAR
ncbi:MAG: hypothetical protein ACXVEF_33915 [Polyangiales bacterium]